MVKKQLNANPLEDVYYVDFHPFVALSLSISFYVKTWRRKPHASVVHVCKDFL